MSGRPCASRTSYGARAICLLTVAGLTTLGACKSGPPDVAGTGDRGGRAARQEDRQRDERHEGQGEGQDEEQDEHEEAGHPIDVAGHLSIAARPASRPLRDVWQWGAVPVGIAVGRDGSVYWAQYRTDTIERTSADGSGVETIAAVDGPLGLTLDHDSGRLFYVTDRHYPRSVASLRPGEQPQTLFSGFDINRPFAIAVAEGDVRLFWTESINGRVRSAGVDGGDVDTIFDDGIANVGESSNVVALSSAGIAVDEQHGSVFWSDLRTATIVRARLDGSERETILAREQGLEFPTGLALDAAAGKLYWADAGAETISRADLDGLHPEVIASAADGVLEPYGLAIDAPRGLLYWTDVARNALYRTALDPVQVEIFRELGGSSISPPDDPENADSCAGATTRVQREFLRRWVKRVRTCVIGVSATKAVMRSPGDLRLAAGTCSRQLGATRDVRSLRAALEPHCDAAQLAAAIEETLLLGAEIIAADLPRSAPYLRAIRPFVADPSGADEPGTAEALAAIDDLLDRLEQFARLERLARLADAPASPVAWTLPASGQTTRYAAATRLAGGPIVVPDDGATRAGAPSRFVDNGDGTISDAVTGLMWEKKCDGCGSLHDFDERYWWDPAEDGTDVTGWLKAINAEDGPGFAGHDDWRLPEIGELLSIIDFEQFNPAVGVAFDGSDCGWGCSSLGDPECSCTQLGAYWTAGTSPHPDDVMPVVAFSFGAVFGQSTDDDAFVRAVRGPVDDRDQRFMDNGDGTVTDRVTRLMWEKKCLSPGDLHDVDRSLYWSFDGTEETIWDWLVAINNEGGRGFAGHADWRIPNVKELYSLFDGRHSDPSTDPVFAGSGCPDVVDPSCSLTANWPYWTSTTFADFPALALAVGFSTPGELDDEPPPWVIRVTGGVEPHQKTLRMVARAVRGPVQTTP